MRPIARLVVLLAGSIVMAQGPPVISPVGSVKELMLDIIHPSLNDILLVVHRGGPQSDEDWRSVRRSALMLAESGNLLISRGPATDAWVKNVKLLVEAGTAAYRSALAKDAKKLAESADNVDTSCTQCHRLYRPDVFPRETTK